MDDIDIGGPPTPSLKSVKTDVHRPVTSACVIIGLSKVDFWFAGNFLAA